MQIPLRKSFRLLKFLNGRHSVVTRLCFALPGYIIALMATGQPALAKGTYSQYFGKSDFKLASRRLAWLTQNSWMNLKISSDGIFDFTADLDRAQITALSQFVDSKFFRVANPIDKTMVRAFISARKLEMIGTANEGAHELAAFNSDCQVILDASENSNWPQKSSQMKESRSGDFPISDAVKAMKEFAELFPNTEHPWFVISGTFLGLIREKGFLPHDYDIDLGILEPDLDLDYFLSTISQSDRFVLKKLDSHTSTFNSPPPNTRNNPAPYIIKIDHVSGLNIDLFVHYNGTAGDQKICWHGTSLHRWSNSEFKVKLYDFYDMKVLGPEDADRYLTENYGDWRTPVTDFNCTTDTPNLDLVNHPTSIAIFLNKLLLASRSDPKEAADIIRTLEFNGYVTAPANVGGGRTFSFSKR